MITTNDLYHQRILTVARSGVGSGRLSAPNATAVVHNLLCGDRITLDLSVDSGRITALAHAVKGCLLCQAAAVVLTQHVPDMAITTLSGLEAQISTALASNHDNVWEDLPDWAIFKPVQAYPSRHRCVCLPCEALQIALQTLVTQA